MKQRDAGVIASVEKINSKREKDYLQNYFTCVNKYCMAIRVLQCFQEGSNFPLKCEMRGNSFHERSIFFLSTMICPVIILNAFTN